MCESRLLDGTTLLVDHSGEEVGQLRPHLNPLPWQLRSGREPLSLVCVANLRITKGVILKGWCEGRAFGRFEEDQTPDIRVALRLKSIMFNAQSAFQLAQIIDTSAYGKVCA